VTAATIWTIGVCAGCDVEHRLGADGNVMRHRPPLHLRVDDELCAGVGGPPLGPPTQRAITTANPEPAPAPSPVRMGPTRCSACARPMGTNPDGRVRLHFLSDVQAWCEGSGQLPQQATPKPPVLVCPVCGRPDIRLLTDGRIGEHRGPANSEGRRYGCEGALQRPRQVIL